MALRGNLKDFSLPDVFQLVQLSGKTGVLRIVRSDIQGSIWFRDGDVFFAQSNWRHELLGERLVSAQRITPAALKRALEIHDAEGGSRRLGEILVSEGYITQQVLESFVQEQIEDTIFDIMRWDEGDFDFETLPEVAHEDIGLSVSVENIVMEGSRRLEEWNRIKKKVPSADMVFKMATAPGEGTFEISLKPVEWNLLLLIDGTRSVRDLALEIRSTDFEVARVIYGLFSAGLLEVPSEEEVERLRAERAAREAKRERAHAEAAAAPETVPEPAVEAGPEAGPAPEPVIGDGPAAEVEPMVDEPLAEAALPESERAPHEVPEFLAVAVESPTDDDMAVFTEMMEAVLHPHGAVPEVAEPLAPVAEAAVPLAEPVEAADFEESEGPFVPDVLDQWAESMLPPEETVLVEPEPEAAVAPPVFEGAVGPDHLEEPYADLGAISLADLADIPAPPVAEVAPLPEGEHLPESALLPETAPPLEPAPLPEGFSPTGDFETDLRTLGLGEYPAELLEPEPGPEPVSESREPMSAVESDYSFFEPTPAPELALEPAPEPEPERGGAPDAIVADDLDSLLESLSAPADMETGEPAGIISSGTDFGAADEPGEYISTDSFLAEFDGGDALGGGLGDELTALTGGGSGRARPVATVNSIPEPGEATRLRIDQAVDRELLEKIIKGVEEL